MHLPQPNGETKQNKVTIYGEQIRRYRPSRDRLLQRTKSLQIFNPEKVFYLLDFRFFQQLLTFLFLWLSKRIDAYKIMLQCCSNKQGEVQAKPTYRTWLSDDCPMIVALVVNKVALQEGTLQKGHTKVQERWRMEEEEKKIVQGNLSGHRNRKCTKSKHVHCLSVH